MTGGRLLKIAGLAAAAGGAYFFYDVYVSPPPKEVNLQKAGRVADERIMHLSGKAQEAEQGATANALHAKEQAKEQLQNAASSLNAAATSLTDKTINGVDSTASESRNALTQVKGWLTGK